MVLGYVGLDLMLMDNNINRLDRRVERQLLRMAENPFDLTNEEFKQLYRLTPDIVFNLIDVLEPQLQRTRINGLSIEKQVLAALRFYATGCFQRPVGEQWGISMSQSSISRCVHKVTDAINNLIFRQWIQFPITAEARYQAKLKFQNARHSFEGAIGAIDCSHVAIIAPRIHEEAYVNHHGYHSL
ncbi:Putative nuclease HARBI1, partial [Camponotus floridanus]